MGKPDSSSSASRDGRALLGAAVFFALLSVAYRLSLGLVLSSVDGYYVIETWRQTLLEDRLRGYAWFLPSVAASLLLLSVLIRGKPAAAPGDRPAAPWARALPWVAGAGVLAFSAWLSHREWLRYGRPCWDGYCEYASLIANSLRDPSQWPALRDFLHRDYHANSPLAPFLIACVSRAFSCAPELAFCWISGLASAGTLALVGWMSARFMASRSLARLPASILLASHFIFARSFLFPQTDALLMLWMTAALAVALMRFRRPAAWQVVAGNLIVATGLLLKLSFLPVLALFPLMRVFRIEPGRSKTAWLAGAVAEGALFGLLPASAFFLFQWGLGTREMFRQELAFRGYIDRNALMIIESTFHAFLLWTPVLWLARRHLRRIDLAVLSWVGVYLCSLWFGRAPGWDRHYLPLLPPAALLASKGLEPMLNAWGTPATWAFVLLCAALNALSFAWLIVH